jgi:DNA-binding transcriptional regulator/RsmH inhibitor MraZ
MGTRGRVVLPSRFVDLVGKDALVVSDVPGRVRLLPWHPNGERVHQRSTDLRGSLAEATSLRALVDLESLYERVAIEDDGRFTLPPGARLHLGVEPGSDFIAWALRDHVELWSLAHRNARLEDVASELDDMP